MLEVPKRHAALIVALVVAASAGGVGMAYGSSHRSADPARKATGKKSHTLSADYKTAPGGILNTTPTTVEFADDAKLVGRPFGNRKAHLAEDSLITYNVPYPFNDFSGTEHTTFKAAVFGRGGFRGFYDFTLDPNGNPEGAINGVITGGSGTFRGAKGSFQVLDRVAFHLEDVQYRGHWQGSIRY